jgi:hypothetical protein
MSWKRRILFAAVPIVFIYVLAEIVITSLFLFSEPVGSMQINEEIRSPLYQYDPVIGSRLSPKKFRTAILRPNGAVESTATIQGNNLGFPDASDFLPKKPAGVARRYAVFGGSYIAGLYMSRRFPDRLEELEAKSGQVVEYMNCCAEGSGLTNWWLFITKVLEPQAYELDGIIFTVSDDNLYRGLLAMHDSYERGWHTVYLNQIRTKTAAEIPQTFNDAKPLLYHVCMADSFCPSQVFDQIQASQGDANYRVPRSVLTPLRPFLFWFIYCHARDYSPPHSSTLFGKPAKGGNFDDMATSRIAEIRRFLESRQLPAVVIQLPPSSERPSKFSEWIPQDTLEFANRLGVPFWDGREAYQSMSDADYAASFLENDPHWNQQGSDYFAKACFEHIRQYPMTKPRSLDWQPIWFRHGLQVILSPGTEKTTDMRVALESVNVPQPWNEWDAQLTREVQVKAQVKYALNFEARSNQPRSLVCAVTDPNDEKNQAILWQKFELTPEWKSYRSEFVAKKELDRAKLALRFGNATVPFEVREFSFGSEMPSQR